MLKYITSFKTVVLFIPLFLVACSNEEVNKYAGIVEDQTQTIYSQAEGSFSEIQIPEKENVEVDELLGNIDDERYGYQTQEADAAVQAIEAEIEQLEDNGADEDEIEVIQHELKQAQSRLNQAQYEQSQTEIIAPNDGTISEWMVRAGDMVTTGTPLLTIILDEPMELTIHVPQEKLSEFTIGDTVNISAIAIPDNIFEGEVIQVADEAVYSPQSMETNEDKAQKVFPVKIQISEKEELKSGMDVTVETN